MATLFLGRFLAPVPYYSNISLQIKRNKRFRPTSVTTSGSEMYRDGGSAKSEAVGAPGPSDSGKATFRRNTRFRAGAGGGGRGKGRLGSCACVS